MVEHCMTFQDAAVLRTWVKCGRPLNRARQNKRGMREHREESEPQMRWNERGLELSRMLWGGLAGEFLH